MSQAARLRRFRSRSVGSPRHHHGVRADARNPQNPRRTLMLGSSSKVAVTRRRTQTAFCPGDSRASEPDDQ
jgi:hypothetical protein